jgi:hypothetical protein
MGEVEHHQAFSTTRQMMMRNTTSKKKSREGETNLNGMWLRLAVSLLDCFPPNSKTLNLSKLSTNS